MSPETTPWGQSGFIGQSGLAAVWAQHGQQVGWTSPGGACRVAGVATHHVHAWHPFHPRVLPVGHGLRGGLTAGACEAWCRQQPRVTELSCFIGSEPHEGHPHGCGHSLAPQRLQRE